MNKYHRVVKASMLCAFLVTAHVAFLQTAHWVESPGAVQKAAMELAEIKAKRSQSNSLVKSESNLGWFAKRTAKAKDNS